MNPDEINAALLETPPEPWGTHQTLRYVVRYPGNGHSVAVLCFKCRSPWPCDGILSQIEAHHHGHRPAFTGSLDESRAQNQTEHLARTTPQDRTDRQSFYVVMLPNLKRERLKLPLSQQELSKLSGVAASTIARIESGAEAHPSTVRRLAEALHCPTAELMGEAS